MPGVIFFKFRGIFTFPYLFLNVGTLMLRFITVLINMLKHFVNLFLKQDLIFLHLPLFKAIFVVNEMPQRSQGIKV